MNLPFSILIKERTDQEINHLKALSMMIPFKSFDKLTYQKILQRLFNIVNFNKIKIKNKTLQMYKSMIANKTLTIKDQQDPVQKLLIRAIINKQSWEEIIIKNQWQGILVQRKEEWSSYEQWIIFICFQGFDKSKAFFLSSNITKRSLQSIRVRIRVINTPQNQDKLRKWLGKDGSQINQIHYEIERKLLLSIKQKKDFYEVANILNLTEILKLTTFALSDQRNKWVTFLCSKFPDNLPLTKPVFRKHGLKVSWSQCRPRFTNILEEYQLKLHSILEYANFQQRFTNEIQVSLLSDILLKSSWKEAKKHIQDLSSPFVSHRINKEEELTFIQQNENNDLSQKNSLFPQQESKDDCKIKEVTIKSIANKRSLTPQKQTKITSPSKQQIKSHSSLINNKSLPKNDKKPSKTKTNKKILSEPKIPKKSSSASKNSKQKKGKKQSNKKKDSLSPNHLSTQSKIINNQIQEHNFNSFQQLKQRDKSTGIIPSKNSPKQNQFTFSSQQRLIMSLLGKLRQWMQQFQQNYFSNISSRKIQSYWVENMEMIEPMHRPILSIYRNNDRQMIDEIKNINIKKLIQVILTVEPQFMNKDHCDLKKNEHIPESKQKNKDMAQAFALGFDKLVAKLQSKKMKSEEVKQPKTPKLLKMQKSKL